LRVPRHAISALPSAWRRWLARHRSLADCRWWAIDAHKARWSKRWAWSIGRIRWGWRSVLGVGRRF